MKKQYMKPTVKTLRLPELMQANVTGSELDPEKFELGAKGVTLGEGDDENEAWYDNKSVWED